MSATANLLTEDRGKGEADKAHLYNSATRKAQVILTCVQSLPMLLWKYLRSVNVLARNG